jgi:hypothetical protein
MSTKSEQLQIRVSPEEKVALKRRARAAGQDVSTYVLSRALPPTGRRFAGLVAALCREGERRYVLAELNEFLTGLPPGRFTEAVGEADVRALPPVDGNYVAAMVEQAAALKGVEPPAWTLGIAPLEEPYFATELRSLRPHLLRASPVPYKRRNLFVDAGVGDRV